MTAARIQEVMAVNVTGALLCAREAVKRMSTKFGGKGGVIVNISSVAARLGSANTYVDYAASKAAIDALTIGLSHEVATDGIRVAGIHGRVLRLSHAGLIALTHLLELRRLRFKRIHLCFGHTGLRAQGMQYKTQQTCQYSKRHRS